MKNTLVLNVDRESYKIISDDTMTVGQLQSILDDFDDDTPICFGNDKNGYQKWYTYGYFSESDIHYVTDEDFEDKK